MPSPELYEEHRFSGRDGHEQTPDEIEESLARMRDADEGAEE